MTVLQDEYFGGSVEEPIDLIAILPAIGWSHFMKLGRAFQQKGGAASLPFNT